MKISYKIKDFGETFEVEIDDGFISGLWKDGKDVMDDQDEDYLDHLYWLAVQEARDRYEEDRAESRFEDECYHGC